MSIEEICDKWDQKDLFDGWENYDRENRFFIAFDQDDEFQMGSTKPDFDDPTSSQMLLRLTAETEPLLDDGEEAYLIADEDHGVMWVWTGDGAMKEAVEQMVHDCMRFGYSQGVIYPLKTDLIEQVREEYPEGT